MVGGTMPLMGVVGAFAAPVATRLSVTPNAAMPPEGAITMLPELLPVRVWRTWLTVNVRLVLPPLVSASVPPARKVRFRVEARPTVTAPPVAAGAMARVPDWNTMLVLPRGEVVAAPP